MRNELLDDGEVFQQLLQIVKKMIMSSVKDVDLTFSNKV